MSLHTQMTDDLKIAMKAGDTLTRDVLRMVDSAIKNDMIEKGTRDEGPSDEDAVSVVKRLVKQRKDSASQYRAGGRDELAHKEEQEIVILEKYLPVQMSDAAVRDIVATVIADAGATSKADMGRVMSAAMAAVGDGADGGTVKKIVDALLS